MRVSRASADDADHIARAPAQLAERADGPLHRGHFTYIAPILLHEAYADRSIDGTLIVTLASVAVLLLLFSFGMRQPLVVAAAGDAPNLASAMNIGAFNLGNAIGLVLGGAELGFPAVALAGAAMAACGLGLVLVLRQRGRASGKATVSLTRRSTAPQR